MKNPMKQLWRAGRRATIKIPRRRHLGAPPGAARADTEVKLPPREGAVPPPRIFCFNETACEQSELEDTQHLERAIKPDCLCWIDFEGVSDSAQIEAVARHLGWHPLVVEDILSLHQRPKAEDYDDYAYLVLLMPSGPEGLPLEQLNLLFGQGYVATIQSGQPGDCLEPVRDRIRTGRGRVRERGADYLAYAIIDTVVDHYFPIVEELSDRLDSVESTLATSPTTLEDMHAIRNDLYGVWRAVESTREAIGRLVRGEMPALSAETRTYLRDCHDHCAQLLDAIGACRELSTSLMDLHESIMNNRMGEGMRVLTMIATIFMPMSFIAGVYGMNFDPTSSPLNMPELGWRYGYPFALALMFGVGFGFAWFFRRRGWLSSQAPRRQSSRPKND